MSENEIPFKKLPTFETTINFELLGFNTMLTFHHINFPNFSRYNVLKSVILDY